MSMRMLGRRRSIGSFIKEDEIVTQEDEIGTEDDGEKENGDKDAKKDEEE